VVVERAERTDQVVERVGGDGLEGTQGEVVGAQHDNRRIKGSRRDQGTPATLAY